jgi:hypothetical protein
MGRMRKPTRGWIWLEFEAAAVMALEGPEAARLLRLGMADMNAGAAMAIPAGSGKIRLGIEAPAMGDVGLLWAESRHGERSGGRARLRWALGGGLLLRLVVDEEGEAPTP